MAELTHAQLLELMHYDAETGVFTRRNKERLSRAGNVGYVNRYLVVRVIWKKYLAHRLAWFYVHGEWPSSELDHINGDKLDNRIANLRLANRSQNNANTRCRSKVGMKGVVEVKGKYRAGITVSRRFYYLGMFDTPEQAHEAYLAKARQVFGEFHRAN